MHKYQCDIYCSGCKKMTNIPDDKSYQFEIPLNNIDSYEMIYLKKDKGDTINISNYIRNNISNMSDLHCTKCMSLNKLIKINRLRFIPTILTITYLKYQNKKLVDFPKFLEYENSNSKKKYIYILTSSIEQSGNIHSGHYICKSKRKKYTNSKINTIPYLFNDTVYKESDLEPTSNTYVIFYHFYNSIDI